jgi:hypothetical protein
VVAPLLAASFKLWLSAVLRVMRAGVYVVLLMEPNRIVRRTRDGRMMFRRVIIPPRTADAYAFHLIHAVADAWTEAGRSVERFPTRTIGNEFADSFVQRRERV